MAKSLSEYLMEKLNEEVKVNIVEADHEKGEPTITDEKSFREAARAKFEEVFGDDLDEKKMKETIDGLLEVILCNGEDTRYSLFSFPSNSCG